MKRILVALTVMLFTLPCFAQNTILIIGDSLSAAYGIDPNKGWVSLLKSQLQTEGYDYKVVNASISGDTTSNGLARLPQALHQHNPTITIIELGANDGLRGLSIQTIKQNLRSMIQLAKKSNSAVLLIGIRLPPNYGPDYTQIFQEMFHDLAASENIPLVPFFLNHVDEDAALMQSDRLHPSEKAQRYLLQNVWPELVKMLAKPAIS